MAQPISVCALLRQLETDATPKDKQQICTRLPIVALTYLCFQELVSQNHPPEHEGASQKDSK